MASELGGRCNLCSFRHLNESKWPQLHITKCHPVRNHVSAETSCVGTSLNHDSSLPTGKIRRLPQSVMDLERFHKAMRLSPLFPSLLPNRPRQYMLSIPRTRRRQPRIPIPRRHNPIQPRRHLSHPIQLSLPPKRQCRSSDRSNTQGGRYTCQSVSCRFQ